MLWVLLLSFPFILASAAPSVTIKYTTNEKKAIRREMIESDIAIRTLASLISVGQYKEIEQQFISLSRYQIANHPDLKGPFNLVVKKWQNAGIEKYAQVQHKVAGDARSLVKNKVAQTIPWTKVQSAFNDILQSCRDCHEATGVGLYQGG